jgi:hypothetical protein
MLRIKFRIKKEQYQSTVMATAMMLLHAVFEFSFTVDADMRRANFCIFGSLLSFTVANHECIVQGIRVLFQ